jgi:hypothetical protein
MARLKRVYIAGAYSADNVLSVFENMRKGMMLANQVRQLGYAPWCPWMDFMYFFINNDEPYSIQNCYEYSLAWLEVSDAILFTPDWRTSHGAKKEHEYAVKHEIPIYYTLSQLVWDDVAQ